MANVDTIKIAIADYLDNELMPKMEVGSVQKVLAGTAISIALKRSESFCKQLASNSTLNALGIIDAEGNVDVDLLREELKQQIPTTGMSISIPIIGKMTFHASDVDTLYNYIKKAEG